MKYNDKLKSQLLSALAAIEKVKKVAESFMVNNERAQILLAVKQSGDLSLLHEHDAKARNEGWTEGREHQRKCEAEARKPLMDALEELLDTSKDVRTGVFPTEAHLNARKKSVQLLAKVKQ